MVASISTWAISSVPTSSKRSRYLAGPRQFQPWKRYCIITVISPKAPPKTSWSFLAYTGSGRSGLAWYCSRLSWKNRVIPPHVRFVDNVTYEMGGKHLVLVDGEKRDIFLVG